MATQKALQHTWDISHTNYCYAHTAQKWLQCAVGTAQAPGAVTAQSEVLYLTTQADCYWVKAGLALTPEVESMERVQFKKKKKISNLRAACIFFVSELNKLYFGISGTSDHFLGVKFMSYSFLKVACSQSARSGIKKKTKQNKNLSEWDELEESNYTYIWSE